MNEGGNVFYFAFVFLIISLVLLITNRKDGSTRYFIYVMFSYTLALFFMMTYLAKDTYYNNVVVNYFSMPLAVWKYLMFLPVNKEFILVLWNLACLAVPYFSLCFALSFSRYGYRPPHVALKRWAAVVLILEYMIYHPLVIRYAYILLYPQFFSVQQLEVIRSVIHVLTVTLNIVIILASIIMLVTSYQRVTPLGVVRNNMLLVVFGYTLIMGSYLFILGIYPAFLIKVSKIAGELSFLSVPIGDHNIIHSIFPYYLMGMLLLIGLFLYRYARTRRRIEEQSITLSKQIAASDTTSKVFCHYMKNELLAVRYELEASLAEGGESETLRNAVRRCENLYHRLDLIHTGTKASELYMTRVNLQDYLAVTLENMRLDLAGFELEFDAAGSDLYVMLDENYFEQALHNIYLNALEAMRDLPENRKKLSVTARAINNWAAIFIRDQGCGISAEDLKQVFQPFYTSHPLAKHWGVGLTLTHKIITAHEGYIEIESEAGIETTVKIMLPLLNI